MGQDLREKGGFPVIFPWVMKTMYSRPGGIEDGIEQHSHHASFTGVMWMSLPGYKDNSCNKGTKFPQ